MIRPFYRPCDQALEAAADGDFRLTKINLEEAALDYSLMVHEAKKRHEYVLADRLYHYWGEVLDECQERLDGKLWRPLPEFHGDYFVGLLSRGDHPMPPATPTPTMKVKRR